MRRPERNERGATLVEAMVGIVLLATVLLGLAGSAGHAMQQMHRSRETIRVWAVVQAKVDSLIGVGAAAISSGSDVVDGRNVRWLVSGVNPRRIDVVVDRLNFTTHSMQPDTIVYFLNP